MHQTRRDIGRDIIKLATDAVEAFKEAPKALETMDVYNKTVKFAQNNRRKIRYTSCGTTGASFEDRWWEFRQLRLVISTDAGFGTLTGSRPIEGSVAILAEISPRGGSIKCHGTLLGHRCAKIQRACKSSLAAACRASIAASDQSLRLQALLREIVNGHYIIQHLSRPTELPLPDPFGPSPSGDEVRWKCKSASTKKNIFQTSCTSCNCSRPTAQLITHDEQRNLTLTRQSSPALMFRPLVLTDCRSLYIAILRIHPLSQDKCAKLILNQLRDLQAVLDISFVDNSCNLGDVETKNAGSLGILAIFVTPGRFQISFLGRKARKESQKWILLSHTIEPVAPSMLAWNSV